MNNDNEFVGFQTWIGFADIKSAPAYFYVQRGDVTFNQSQIPIPFDVLKLNAGGLVEPIDVIPMKK
jgi:hypothetical protein